MEEDRSGFKIITDEQTGMGQELTMCMPGAHNNGAQGC